MESTLRAAESEAQWRRGSQVEENASPAVMVARLKHLGLSAIVGAASATPYIAAGVVTGPIGAGVITVASIGVLVLNRDATIEYVSKHPEEFIAGIAGMLAAGVAVGEIRSGYNKYKAGLSKAERLRVEKLLDKGIEQGPINRQSKAIPKDYADYVAGEGEFNFEQYMGEKFWKANPDAYKKWVLEQQGTVLLRGAGDIKQYLTVQDLVKLHPELRAPYVNPSQAAIEMGRLGYARPQASSSSLLSAALAVIARQGYISESDLKALIKQNTLLLSQTGQTNIQDSISESKVKDLTVQDTITIVKPIEDTLQKPREDTIMEPFQDNPPKPPELPEDNPPKPPELTEDNPPKPKPDPPKNPDPDKTRRKPTFPQRKGFKHPDAPLTTREPPHTYRRLHRNLHLHARRRNPQSISLNIQ